MCNGCLGYICACACTQKNDSGNCNACGCLHKYPDGKIQGHSELNTKDKDKEADSDGI